MKKEISEGNKLIAEFMGLKPQSDKDGRYFDTPDSFYKYDVDEWKITNTCTTNTMMYHSSWDWLMPVVEKIELIVFNENNSFNVTIGSGNYCVIQDSNGEVYDAIEDYKETKLLTTYSAVVKFIKWYNGTTKTMEKEILEGNRLIAEFMTEEPEVLARDLKRAGTLESMQYHESWDWLMPVVEKINLLDEYEYSVTIYTMDCHIQDKKGNTVISIDCKNTVDELIKSVYSAVLEFIKWYNSIK